MVHVGINIPYMGFLWESHVSDILGGGNSNIFGIFTPKIGEDEPNLTIAYFCRWVG